MTYIIRGESIEEEKSVEEIIINEKEHKKKLKEKIEKWKKKKRKK